MEPEDDGLPIKKANREKREQADKARPIVHGALPYYGHRPAAKFERRRLAKMEQQARKSV